MIFDNIKNYERYENISNNFKKAFEFLRREDLKELSSGRYEIDRDEIFALVQTYETIDINSKVYEVHKKYIDIQFMLEGEERVGFSPIGNLKVNTAYEEGKDVMFMDGEKKLSQLNEGDFFVFFPEEPHMPGIMNCEKKEVKKVVIKIKA